MTRRRHDHRRGTWRWQPRPRPADTATETTDADAADDSTQGKYTTGQLTWRLGELGFTTPRRPRHDDNIQNGDHAA